MSAHPSKTSRSGHQSLFYRDLASPISQKGKFSNSGQAAAVTALWRENFGGADPPPPPVFTLEDRIDFSPDVGEFPASPDRKSERKSPSKDSITPFRGRLSFGGAENTPLPASNVSGTSNWWMSGRSGGGSVEEQRKGSPVDGIVRAESNGGVGLLVLPPPREAVRPEVQRSNLPSESMNEEEWVTVYGFSPADTNLVLREFEKCGVILKHIPGPRDANWMHILYQNHFDAQRALAKNGMQLNGVLIIGVKPLDPMLRQALGEKVGDRAFMILPPQSSAKSPTLSLASKSSEDAMRHTQPRQTPGAIAAPSKSVVSKVMDLMFGV